MSDFTQEEYDAINLEDYEDFYMDLSEIPEMMEAQAAFNSRKSKHFAVFANGKEVGTKEMMKFWILTHPEIKRIH